MLDSIKRLLRLCGHNPNDYEFTTYGDYLAATDLTAEEVGAMKGAIEYVREKKVVPISGYITETKKGSYFVPVDNLPIMKIDCKPRPKYGVCEDGPYSLKMGYR